MIERLLKTCVLLLLTISVYGQELSNEAELPSHNDQAVEHSKNENHWEAIQAFERAIRTTGRQRRVAKDNLSKFKSDVDLPAHSVLHFGWSYGLGKLAHSFFNNFWLFLSIAALMGSIMLYFMNKKWSWNKVLPLLCLAVLSFAMSQFRAAYIEANDLVIFKTNSDLKDKPYDASGEKQIVFEGQMAKVEQRYEGFILVQTDTYETGWVSENDVVGVWQNMLN